ncbi:hypothetical protein LPJ59_000274 [Coemansia sp. RSA 2399]|nr:hypothetical protein LPJ59_000274 [Coemansia sp. RSA 2399]
MTLFRSSSVHDTLLTSQHARRPARPATAGSSLRPPTQSDYGSAQPDYSCALPMSRSASVRAPPAMHQPKVVAEEEDEEEEDHSYSTQGPTYYDVLKCRGEFATPSAFFARPIKPTHSSAAMYPWATQPASISTANQQDGSKHRLRRSANTSSTDSASSVFAASTDNALPPSVFRLPGARLSARRMGSENDPWALAGMTAGGRALRKADQLILSPFDRKLTLS